MWGKSFINSTIGRKVLMSLTGLFLCTYLIVHLIGNILLMADKNGDLFLSYANFMGHNPVIRVIEIVLVLAFLIHIIDSVILTINNRKARGTSYKNKNGAANSTWTSRNMGFLGTILLIFLIIHVIDFFLPARFPDSNAADNALFNHVRDRFQIWWYSLFYIIAMVALAFHLWHGVKNAFRTLGLHHSKYVPIIKFLGYAFAIIFPLGFAFIPVYFYFGLYEIFHP